MKAKTNCVVDGQFYHVGDEIWDLGSFEAVSVNGNQRHYEGLNADVSKLPHYVSSGSSALCLDTGDYYKYSKNKDTWYKL